MGGGRKGIAVVCTLEGARVPWLPHFIRHYRAQGVRRFHLTVQCDTGQRRAGEAARRRALQLIRPLGVSEVLLLERDYDAMAVRQHHDEIQRESEEAWFVWADIDEFQIYPHSLPRLIAEWERMGARACPGILVDRVTRSGDLPVLDPSKGFWGQFPVGSMVTRDILRGEVRKVACSHESIQILPGNHGVAHGTGIPWVSRQIPIFHFKWDRSVLDRLQVRLTEGWKARCHWWPESARMYEALQANHGRLPLARLATFDFRDDAFPKSRHPYRINSRYDEWRQTGEEVLWRGRGLPGRREHEGRLTQQK